MEFRYTTLTSQNRPRRSAGVSGLLILCTSRSCTLMENLMIVTQLQISTESSPIVSYCRRMSCVSNSEETFLPSSFRHFIKFKILDISGCSSLPEDWRELKTETEFPVGQGTTITVSCQDDDVISGSDVVTCNTYLYQDLEYTTKPSCIQSIPGKYYNRSCNKSCNI